MAYFLRNNIFKSNLKISKGLIIAFTTEFIPRQVYRYLNYSGNKLGIGSLDGYVDFTLSIKNMTLGNRTLTCQWVSQEGFILNRAINKLVILIYLKKL